MERWQSWPIAPDLKSGVPVRVPWVRILLSLHYCNDSETSDGTDAKYEMETFETQ